MVIKTKEAVRRYIELICRGRDCWDCPIRDLCGEHLGLKTPQDANFENIENLFVAIGGSDYVDSNL